MIHDVHSIDADNGGRFRARLDNAADTETAGAALAEALQAGLVVYLQGDLGAGKTTLARGVLRALGHDGKVKSPTYTLIEPYVVSRLNLYHFDFYRFHSPEEYLEAGLDEYFAGDGACLVEWPQKAAPYVAKPDVEAYLEPLDRGRLIEIRALTESGQLCAQKMLSTLKKQARN